MNNPNDMTTWRTQLEREFRHNGDKFDKMITTLSDGDLNKTFDSGYGGSNGTPFTAWGEKFVYFPAVYDGAEWVASVSRNPCDVAKNHVGGE